MKPRPPQIPDTPGIIWRPHGAGWEARWQCRTDMIKRGFEPKSQRLWVGQAPTEAEAKAIADGCRRLQDEMLLFGRGGMPEVRPFDGTFRTLVNCYQTDPDSTYHKLRYHVRTRHEQMLRRMVGKYGHMELTEFKGRVVLAQHKEWTDDGKKIASGHFFVGQLRVLFGFGTTLLEDPECERMCGVLSKMRFPSPKPRTESITADQVVAIRTLAHRRGWHSIARASTIQFEALVRQKDAIGEWVPLVEPGISDVQHNGKKWLRGIRWDEIDDDLIIRHVTSKKDKPLEFGMKLSPMMMEELRLFAGIAADAPLTRAMLPASGPVIVCEYTQRPWVAGEYRRKWRMLAREAGVPDKVFNMDSRAGGITEATDAGADIEHVRHAATHSNIAMTQRYSRGASEKIAKVMRIRAESRNKTRTSDE